MPNIDDIKQEVTAFKENPDIYGKEIHVIPRPQPEIGIDLNGTISSNIIEAGDSSHVDLGKIESFTQVSQNRDSLYSMLDTMAEDSTISAVLETYAEDATETNDDGKIIWCQSDDADVSKYIAYLLDDINVEKNIYKWVYSLIKYGDLYLRLYHESEFTDELFNDKDDAKKKQLNEALESINKQDIPEEEKQKLRESIIVKIYSVNDKLVHYLEMVSNPAEMFELTKFGKSYAYIKAPISSNMSKKNDNLLYNTYRYSFKKKDVQIFEPTNYVHASLEDDSPRVPEEVQIFIDDKAEYNEDEDTNLKYNVKRGQSLLFNSFKIWRQMMLLENAMLLNRLTKSSMIRIFNVEVGDMPKENVGPHMMGIKNLIEQKSSIDTGNAFTEYTNPGSMENNIYVPTHNQMGTISMQNVGGDVNVTGLDDVDYFRQKLFGSLRIPAQYFGFCLRGNTLIPLLNGETVSIEDMYENKYDYIGKGIMGCQQDGTLAPTLISNIALTREKAQFIRIHLDNGDFVDVTDNHRMMLRNGDFIEASELHIGDSLMPFYTRMKGGRLQVLDNKEGKYKNQYRVVAETKFKDIPKGNQIHHTDENKLNDDFSNLENLTLQEHYQRHKNMLHYCNAQKIKENKELGVALTNKGSKMIYNGVEKKMLKPGEQMPEGFDFGGGTKTEETKQKQSASRLRVLEEHPEYKELGGYKKGEATESTIQHLKEGRRKFFDSMNDEERESWGQKQADVLRSNFDMMLAAKMANYEKNHHGRVRHVRFVRCPVCGEIFELKMFDSEYEDYLRGEKFYYCCTEHRDMINKGGKLARSMRLLHKANYDFDIYEQIRVNGDERPDTYCKASTLYDIYKSYIESYVPECNHKVVDIEYLDVVEPAYDITVENDCHTFALNCGIFVHNCDDNAGFSGGTSLSIISSRYAKTIKRIQNTMCQLITDAINLMLLDKGMDSYINRFTIRMQEPTTQEAQDRQAAIANKMSTVSDVMNLVAEIEDPVAKMKILKSMLSATIYDEEVTNVIQEYIDKLEEMDANGESLDGMGDEGDLDLGGGSSLSSHSLPGRSTPPPMSRNAEPDFDTDEGSEDTQSSTPTETVGDLPTPEELGAGDFTDNTLEF